MNKGDIILIPFPFSDLTGSKKRPALVLISLHFDVTVSFFTTQFNQSELNDILTSPSITNGLKRISYLWLSKIATIDKKLEFGKPGFLEPHYIKETNKTLIELFQLDKL